ncbi:MAG: 5-formyltetrahydrofolate cyclo-ligase [Proteobacteria bacterium]|nr:5-formyltetrahydrofolate cyclo-ligase [Pseudomonadota bacterium]
MALPDLQDLRRQLRQQRCSLSAQQQQQHAQQLAAQLRNLREFRNAHQIAAYIAADGEIDPWDGMMEAWQRQKAVYTPVISHLFWERLWFAPADPDGAWRENRFGIPEPIVPRAWWQRANTMDLILLPLVAFDTQGNRLGMGGGFYDRALAFLMNRKHWRQPRLFGLAHSLQQVDSLPRQPWDVPLDGIVTENEILRFSK